MSYVNAAATKIVATHCCICSRPLVDSDSVQFGIGPVCRAKYVKDSVARTDWKADDLLIFGAEHGIDHAELEKRLRKADKTEAAHMAANWLLYFASANYENDALVACVGSMLNKLGYTRVARALVKRFPYVEIEGDKALVLGSYSETLNENLRKLGGVWDRAQKGWVVNISRELARQALIQAMHVSYNSEMIGVNGDLAIETDLKTLAKEFYGVTMVTLLAPKKDQPIKASIRVVMTRRNGLVYVVSPYNPDFVQAAKQARAKWSGDKATGWAFADTVVVKTLVAQFYPNAEVVTQ